MFYFFKNIELYDVDIDSPVSDYVMITWWLIDIHI